MKREAHTRLVLRLVLGTSHIVPVEIIETPEAKLSRRKSPASLVFLWQIEAKPFLLLDYVPQRSRS